MCIQKANRVNFDFMGENIMKKTISYSNFDKLTVAQCLLLFTPPWGGIAYNVLSILYAYYIFMLF